MPQDIEKFPSTFVATTKVVSSLVFRSARVLPELESDACSATDAILRRAALGSPKGRGGFLLLSNEFLASLAHEQILARFLV